MASTESHPATTSLPTCPICSGKDARFFANGTDRLFRAVEGSFVLLRCPNCRCVFQNPIPGEHEISRYYPRQYWWVSDGQGLTLAARILRQLERSYREFVARDHIRFLDRCARRAAAGKKLLLDIGCGSGLLLHLARGRGFEPHGMDISEQAVALARERYRIPVLQGKVGDDIWPPGQFDFVTMFHVLEHLPDPLAALRYVRRILKPDGHLIIQVPNVESLQARIFGARWYGLDVPRHLINFSPHAANLLLQKSGFAVQDRARFSLRDNPASIASSLAPGLDPVGRSARAGSHSALRRALLESAYFGMVLASLPAALLESALGYGGTIWLHARPVRM